MGQAMRHGVSLPLIWPLRMIRLLWRPPLRPHRTLKILILGLRGAGKTTIMHRLQNKSIRPAAVTDNREINEAVIMRGANKFILTEIDLPRDGHRTRVHRYPDWRWLKSAADYQGLIWVVDSQDQANFGTSGEYLKAAMESLRLEEHIPFLILASKNDVEAAVDLNEVHVRLNLQDEFYRDRILGIKACCAITGKGLEDALAWFTL